MYLDVCQPEAFGILTIVEKMMISRHSSVQPFLLLGCARSLSKVPYAGPHVLANTTGMQAAGSHAGGHLASGTQYTAVDFTPTWVDLKAGNVCRKLSHFTSGCTVESCIGYGAAEAKSEQLLKT